MKTTSFLLILATVTAASAGEKHDDFNTIVKRVEQHYGKTHTKVPLMGLVTFATHFTRPLGASDFKLAIIEGVGETKSESLPTFNPGSDWHVVIRSTSRNGDHMAMFGREEGSAIRTLLVTVDNDQAVVMEMRLDPGHFAKMISDKSHGDISSISFRSHDDRYDK